MLANAVGDVPQITTSAYTTTSTPISSFISDSLSHTSSLYVQQAQNVAHIPTLTAKKMEKPVTRRIVQVFIADTDENVPLDKSVLYTGTQKLTDATDQELFFEVPIKEILDKHNAYRATLVNKKVKERTEYLEPVRIRDLKMVVVEVAKF